jgi:hypothetical protein
MSAQDNGGPAFPLHAKDGMTMRDYFAARAPAPMSWFTPTIPPRPEDDWRVGERRCYRMAPTCLRVVDGRRSGTGQMAT